MVTNITKKIAAIITILSLVFFQVLPVSAFEAPTPPPAPTAPPAPTQDITPAPTAPPAPTREDLQKQDEQRQQEEERQARERRQREEERVSQSTEQTNPALTNQQTTPQDPVSLAGNQTGSQTQDGKVGDPSITTGDATNNANLLTQGNNNAGTGVGSGAGGASIINSGNGEASTNDSSVSLDSNSTNIQNNQAAVTNDLNQATITGDNSTSHNVGSSQVTTGDANTTGTVITAVNTNVNGVAVAEFNVADNHTGDIVLDFNAGCISNCSGGSLAAVNTGNGEKSTNNSTINQTTNNLNFQTNDASVGSNLTLTADSGSNAASHNTGGNSSVTTGDANVSGNVLTFANNNLSGNVIYGVVNIFGNLIGDILLPESAINSLPSCNNCSGGNLLAANSGNGENSNNNTNINSTTNNQSFQFNDASIDNNLSLVARSGGNDTSHNTGGQNEINTGNSNVNAQVLNIANSNVAGGNWWLVLINEGGKWIGKIMGAPDGANMAGSAGTQFEVAANGDITAINSGNGENSNNNTTINQTVNNINSQTNNANIVNNLNLKANSGNNDVSHNTGGNNKVISGDANIMANIVNFVNNNITGGGKLVVTVVNVFGSWVGDFVTPGQKKQDKSNSAIAAGSGGQSGNPNNGGSQSSQSSSGASSNGGGLQSIHIGLTGTQNTTVTNLGSGSQSNSGGQVAGISSGNELNGFGSHALTFGDQISKKVININLAWLLLILPIALLYLLSKSALSIVRNLVNRKK